MQCKSCKEEVQSKFGHAISTNVCPFCGENIFDVALQTILNDLKIIMSEMVEKNYTNEVADWLKANYGFHKLENHQVIVLKSDIENSHTQIYKSGGYTITETDNQPPVITHSIENDKIPSAEPTEFAKRAGVKNVGVNSKDKFKDVIAHITNAESEEFEGTDPDYGDISLEYEDEEPLSRKEQLAMVDIFANPQNQQELELERLKKLKAKQAVVGGGGSFVRRG